MGGLGSKLFESNQIEMNRSSCRTIYCNFIFDVRESFVVSNDLVSKFVQVQSVGGRIG